MTLSDTPRAVIASANEWLTEALDLLDGPGLMTSPYLSHRVCLQIAQAAREANHPLTLMTALNPIAVANGYLSINGLKSLLAAGVEIRDVTHLHAKCFILGSRAMLGSANLTQAGLGSTENPNRELGIALSSESATKCRNIIEEWPSQAVSAQDLDELLSQSEKLKLTNPSPREELTPSSLMELSEKLISDAQRRPNRLWIKAEHGEPALEGWRKNSFFASPAKGRPSFQLGDLVLICAMETHDCYAIVEVTGEAEERPHDYVASRPAEATRWPWVNRTKPRLVSNTLLKLKLNEVIEHPQSLQNGHVRLNLGQFAAAVRSLARLASISE